ncbi:formimidoylglutamase [Aestuariirhabdus litorea]|uniref:Formimidoylglutamase n=1 Tax=Aestuariirhabdus litorea TaxID=2528527 RepID=A0A3P3VS42_9GAMM|nr:formimidoylglutamase [Aestuariirhabdus litorea]RRJ83623.1 formimidoylglutamase [Aestuariirhabdus litorea]RWW96844.1 formimidoylglutamase [Endozoicomonadaceae bacterium GTF-13]
MYQSADMSLWRGRSDPLDGRRGERWHHRMLPYPLDGELPVDEGVVISGFCCDEGVRRNQGRTGAALGPDALRRALAGLPATFQGPIYDAGNLLCDGQQLEQAQARFSDHCTSILDSGHRLLLLGGGHEIAWGSFLGLQNHLLRQGGGDPRVRIGIINFDAHFDLRNPAAGPSSGTPFHQIAVHCQAQQQPFRYLCLGVSETANTPILFDYAEQFDVEWRLDREMTLLQLEECRKQLQRFISQVDWIHLSIDLDVLPAATMPGVSAPACPGVSLEMVEALLPLVTAARHPSGRPKLQLAELAEYNPQFDPTGVGARAAARLAYRLLSD